MKELQTIQSRLKVHKGQFNSFGKYRYRSCEDILEAVKPLLSETNCTLTLSDTIESIGNRVYIKATATLSTADGKQSVTTTAYAREAERKSGMDDSQITGTASSYARKYALNGLFCIDDTKDADALNTSPEYTAAQPAQAPQQQPTATPDEAAADILRSADRASFEQAMLRHRSLLADEKVKAACVEISKKYPKQ